MYGCPAGLPKRNRVVRLAVDAGHVLVTTERGTVMLWRPTGLEELQVRRVHAPQDPQLDHDLAQAGRVLTRKYLALSAEISRFLVLAP